jgi:2-keto-4-pentenoate hydratase/2-oxohepta-3-ene-1,7-dioic acid hydratase in catechol pathway
MKICRFKFRDVINNGIIEDEAVFVFDNGQRTSQSFDVAEVELLIPTVPSKIVCVGRNYAEHAAELGNEVPKEPLLFLKAPSSIIRDGEAILIPEQSAQVEHEGELAVVIGRDCKNIADAENVNDFIQGFMCLNDVTARDIQRRDVQFTRGKSFDTFCPVGSFIETDLDYNDISVKTFVNGFEKQSGRTSQMVFSVDFLVRYISRQMTLKAGDIIATGTPSGVSKMNSGDVCEVEIEGVGKLTNPVK